MTETQRTQAEALTALAANHRRVFAPGQIPAGITPTHLQVLIALLSGRAATSRELSDLMALDQSRVTVALAELRERNLVDLVDEPAHRQRKRAALAEGGKAMARAFVQRAAIEMR